MSHDVLSSLKLIDEIVGRRDLDVPFNTGASDEELGQLARVLADSCTASTLAPLNALLSWHNGQRRNAVLIPGENRRMFSLQESLTALDFFFGLVDFG